MSLLDDVSIVVTPNGYKAGELYAVIPSNGDADMDVTRATAATRVDEDGLVNYAKILGDELVTNGDFATDSDWTLGTGATISNNLLNFDSVNNDNTRQLNLFPTPSLGTYEVSFDISNYVGGHIDLYLGGYQRFDFNANSNGTWKQTCVISNPSSNTIFYFIGDNFTGSIDNVSVKEVTRDNVPRIDYTGGGCPHILAEPQRTNLVTYSEVYGSGTFFSATSGSVIDNTTSTSPSGDANATQVTSTGAGKIQSGALSLTQNTDYVLSFYAKNVDATAVTSRVYATGGSGGSNLTSVSYISELSTTEWTKITHSFNTGTNTTIYVYISNSLNSGGTIQLWGAQLEEGSYATSYIPTSGSTVTRNQDIFTRDGIGSLINSTEGVLFVEMAALSDDLTFRGISLNDGTNTNSVGIRYRTNSNRINAIIKDDNGVTFQMNFDVSDITQFNKIALKYKSGDSSLYINGTEVLTDSSTFSFTSALNDASFNRGDGNDDFFGKVKQLQVYDTALTDTQLAALTS